MDKILMKLTQYKKEKDLKKLNNNDLIELANDVRQLIIKEITEQGGHLGSNLSVVELTISLLKNFNLKESMYLFDTSYQCYTYKLLTKTKDYLKKMHQYDGYGIFQEIKENDPYSGGHTSISAAWAGGYNLVDDKRTVIEIIGDASLATSVGLGGMLNFSPNSQSKKGLFIMNDNKQGIGVNKFNYLDWKKIAIGMGFEYFLVQDGHDFDQLQKAWDFFNNAEKSVFLHVMTEKSKGFQVANLENKNHWFSKENKNEIINQELTKSSLIISSFLEKELKNKNTKVFVAGLLYSSGFDMLAKKYPNQIIDTGISEEICLVQAAAMAKAGYNVIVYMVSSFFQRTYDQIVHDIIRANANMLILLAYDNYNVNIIGDSHHAMYDINMLNSFKSIRTYMPVSVEDMNEALKLSLKYKQTVVVRYPANLVNVWANKHTSNWYYLEKADNNKFLIVHSLDAYWIWKYMQKHEIKINLICANTLNPIDIVLLQALIGKDVYFYESIHGYNTLGAKANSFVKNLNATIFSFKKDEIGKWDIEKIYCENNMDYKSVFDIILV